jgi:hypothetical protein
MMDGANVERLRLSLRQATARSDRAGRSRLSRRDVKKVAGQFIAWNCPQKDPSRRERYDRWDNASICSGAVTESATRDQTVPHGTSPSRGCAPGDELPGYDRSIPTGQALPRVDFFLILST